jgi:transketolase
VEHYEAGLGELVDRVDGILAGAGMTALVLDAIPFPARSAPAAPQRLISAYSEELLSLGRSHPEIVALDGDLMVDTGVLAFAREFPDRFIECGIAEQDMVSQAGALALKGKLPIVHSFACFLSTRPNEHIYNNATERTKVIYHASLAGLLPSGPGHSHQSVRDISAVGSVPGLVLIQPGDEAETRLALRWAVEKNRESTYLRLTSVPVDVPYRLPADHHLVIGQGTRIRDGRDGVLISYGPVMLSEAFRAAELLETDGRSLAVFDLPWLNRIDDGWIAEALRDQPALFLIEDHYPELGQSAFVAQALARVGLAVPTHVYGIDGIPVSGQNREALDHHGLSAERLVERISAAL